MDNVVGKRLASRFFAGCSGRFLGAAQELNKRTPNVPSLRLENVEQVVKIVTEKARAIIGAHRFYRLPGSWGQAGAFAARYTGSEPLPRPSMLLPRRSSAETRPLAEVTQKSTPWTDQSMSEVGQGSTFTVSLPAA